jgi:tetratricopeptide (TPR) repeat protein
MVLAQEAIKRQDWDAAMRAYDDGLQAARQQANIRAQQFFLSGKGTTAYRSKNYEAALSIFEDALALAQEIDDPVLVARSYINLGEVMTAQGNIGKAQEYHQRALDTAKPSQDAPTIILAQEKLARTYMKLDNAAYAGHLLKDAATLARETRNPNVGASVLGWWGIATIAAGNRGQGRQHLENAQRLAMQTGRERLALDWVIELAKLDSLEGSYPQAVERFEAAETLARRIGQREPELFLDLSLYMSNTYRKMGRYADAKAQAERAAMHAESIDNPRKKAQTIKAHGLARQAMNDHEAAIQDLMQVLSFYEDGTLEADDERAAVLMALGKSQQKINHPDEARATYEQALKLASDEDDRTLRAEALHWLGTLHNERRERQQAIDYWQQAIRLFEDDGDPGAAARVLCDLGNAQRAAGDLSAARTSFESALTLINSVDDQVTQGLVYSNAANLYTQIGDMENAIDFYQQALDIARELSDLRSEAIRLGNLAWYYVLTGQAQRATELYQQAIEKSQQLGDNLLRTIHTNNLAYAYARLGLHETALPHYEEALAAIGDNRRWRAIFLSNIGETYVAQSQLAEARQAYEEALAISQELDDFENTIRTKHRFAALMIKEGRAYEAGEMAEEAFQDARRMGYRRGQADAMRVLGDLYQQQDEQDAATRYYTRAYEIYKQIQDPSAQDIRQHIST